MPAQLPGVVASVCVIEATPLQSSVAVALPVAATSVELVQLTVVSPGQLITGGVVSTTVMCWTQLVELLQLSVAVNVRVMM